MATAPVTDVDELNRLLRTLREGGERAREKFFGGAPSAQDMRAVVTGGNPSKDYKATVMAQDAAELLGSIPFMDKGGSLGTQRFAMKALQNPALRAGLKWAPVVTAGLAAGDLVLGDESIGNKAMDATLMGIGGIAGSAVPVLGTGFGIAGGKVLSDLTQYLLGGGE